MNADVSSAHKLAGYGALRERPYRIVAGLALSLAVHAALLFGWRHQLRPPADAVPPPRSIAVWLRPVPPPAPSPPAAPPKVVQAEPKAPVARQARVARDPAPSTEVIAIPKAERETPPDTFTVQQPPAETAPHFDPDAAKKFARQIANDPDPARAGTAVGQIAPKPLETETKAARAIASAKRRDCKDGVPGGLLAPLFLLMDKKDSGCKW